MAEKIIAYTKQFGELKIIVLKDNKVVVQEIKKGNN